jgi:catalase-peroxidase
MGFRTFGFGGGRADVWQPQEDVYWGSGRRMARDKRQAE